jgi:hypothetical protein
MRQPPSFSDGCGAPRSRLNDITETKEDNRQERLGRDLRVDPGLPHERVLRLQTTKCKRFLQMGTG